MCLLSFALHLSAYFLITLGLRVDINKIGITKTVIIISASAFLFAASHQLSIMED